MAGTTLAFTAIWRRMLGHEHFDILPPYGNKNPVAAY
jgi:hypothetical protein